MRKTSPALFLFLLFLFCGSLSAQNDTNYFFFNSTLPDSANYQKFEKRIRAIVQQDPAYGAKYARFALDYFTKNNYQPGIAQSYLSIAGSFFYTGKADSMILYAGKALTLFTEQKNNMKISSAYKNI